MSDTTDPKSQPQTADTAPQIFSGVLRRRWRIIAAMEYGPQWQVYSVEEETKHNLAFLVQRTLSTPDADAIQAEARLCELLC
jgi:hypothetical protein